MAPFRGNDLLSYAVEWNVAVSIGYIKIMSECSMETTNLFRSRKPSKQDEPFQQTLAMFTKAEGVVETPFQSKVKAIQFLVQSYRYFQVIDNKINLQSFQQILRRC